MSERVCADLRLVPVNWEMAQGFNQMWHRTHRKPPPGHRFCVGVANGLDVLVGVAIVGNPAAIGFQDGLTLEVRRVATDGNWNANSMLYAACWQVTKGLGFRRLVTYTQAGESGASLRGAGWRVVAERPPRRGWDMPSRPRDNRRYESVPRTLWEAER